MVNENNTCRICKKENQEFYRNFKINDRFVYDTICKDCRIKAYKYQIYQKKIKALEYKGNKCQKCGYDKYHGSLTFHHLDPSKKDSDWSKMRSWSWERIKKELDKCILLCANCHGEEHRRDELELNEIMNIAYSISDHKRDRTRICKSCNKEFEAPYPKTSIRYCSRKCSYSRIKKRISLSIEEKRDLISKYSLEEIAEKFDITLKTVRGWKSKIKRAQREKVT